MARKTAIINFSAPPELAREIRQLAKKENKTQSELIRNAIDAYTFELRLKKLQQKGRVIAQQLGIESYDDVEKYAG